MEKRICTGQHSCGQEKLLTEENFQFHKKWGKFDNTCRECRNKRSKNWNENNKEKHNQATKIYKGSEVGRNLDYSKNGYKLNGQPFTVKDYNSLFLEQEGYCSICGGEIEEKGKSTHVDHKHSTGEVRGLLCHKCNMILGFANDSIDILNKAIGYLKKF